MDLKKKLRNTICVVLLCISGILWLLLVYTYVESYLYRYPFISDGFIFALYTLTNQVIPLICLVLAICFLSKDKAVVAIILCILSVPLMMFTFVRACGEMLFFPSVCSYTTDPVNFGTYDKRLAERLNLNPVACFPASIPEGAKDIEYCYYYNDASDETVYIAIGWSIETNEVDRYRNQFDLDGEETLTASGGVYLFTETFYKNAVILDENAKKVCFVITSDETLLPQQINEAIKSITVLVD